VFGMKIDKTGLIRNIDWQLTKKNSNREPSKYDSKVLPLRQQHSWWHSVVLYVKGRRNIMFSPTLNLFICSLFMTVKIKIIGRQWIRSWKGCSRSESLSEPFRGPSLAITPLLHKLTEKCWLLFCSKCVGEAVRIIHVNSLSPSFCSWLLTGNVKPLNKIYYNTLPSFCNGCYHHT
jgi:hypothetical protein